MSGFKSWWSYKRFANRVRNQLRFLRTEEDEEFLREVLRTSKERIKFISEGVNLWRSRLGYSGSPIFDEKGRHIDDEPVPYPQKRMKPRTDRAREGRVNPRGIPVLYLSTTKDAAMSEVRPWLGSYVSCGIFTVRRRLSIVDFSEHHDSGHIFYFDEPSEQEKEKAVWTHIDQAFSIPTTLGDDVDKYAPTQLLAELFKREGYDGIAYGSMFSKAGHNIALFNPDDAEMTYCELHQVSSVDFTFEDRHTPYWVGDDGKATRIVVEDVFPVPPATGEDGSGAH